MLEDSGAINAPCRRPAPICFYLWPQLAGPISTPELHKAAPAHRRRHLKHFAELPRVVTAAFLSLIPLPASLRPKILTAVVLQPYYSSHNPIRYGASFPPLLKACLRSPKAQRPCVSAPCDNQTKQEPRRRSPSYGVKLLPPTSYLQYASPLILPPQRLLAISTLVPIQSSSRRFPSAT